MHLVSAFVVAAGTIFFLWQSIEFAKGFVANFIFALILGAVAVFFYYYLSKIFVSFWTVNLNNKYFRKAFFLNAAALILVVFVLWYLATGDQGLGSVPIFLFAELVFLIISLCSFVLFSKGYKEFQKKKINPKSILRLQLILAGLVIAILAGIFAWQKIIQYRDQKAFEEYIRNSAIDCSNIPPEERGAYTCR